MPLRKGGDERFGVAPESDNCQKVMLRQALSNILSAMPGEFHRDRAELLSLLRQRGILYRSPTQPVLSRDGTSARWMLDSLSVTLTPRGAELAGRCLLELLKHFDGRQLATYGLTAVPILQSCILQSGGRYHGLLVRKERKPHGSLKLIEGPIDPAQPIILVDDSISSGLSMEEGCARLEEAGLRVEGGICLVRFGWDGGYAAMQERGYHVEALYDIWDDFIYHMADEYKPLLNPSKYFPEFIWSSRHASENLHPAQLSRIVIREFLTTGQLLRAPARLDADYDSSGGVWISLRSMRDIHLRHARDGFWHFPGEKRGTAAEDIVLAALRTALELPTGEEGLKILDGSGIAVTFFSELERCTVGQLDNECYGIVVRSLERPSWMGGALPRMPGIADEWAQFQHARRKNGRLISFEPYEIFRHEVHKAVEEGISWQPTGTPVGKELPWHLDKSVCGLIAERARDIVISQVCGGVETTQPQPHDLLHSELDSLYLTVYINGQLRGCMGSAVHGLDDELHTLARAALDDNRFAVEDKPIHPASIAVSVSLLFNPFELGACPPEEVVSYVRHGQQTLMAYLDNDHVGMLLPFVASTHNLDALDFAKAVMEKGGITETPFWCRLDCATWLADALGTSLLVGGFPDVADAPKISFNERLAQFATLHLQYLVRHQRDDGTFNFSYEPFRNRVDETFDLARTSHAAWTLARACRVLGNDELRSAADKTIELLMRGTSESEDDCWLQIGDSEASVSELSFLLLALCNLDEDDSRRRCLAPRLAATLWNCISLPHGRIGTHRRADESSDAYQDYFPCQVLLALGVATLEGLTEADEERLESSFRYYRHRFRYGRHFGQVSWLMQAFTRWWEATRQPHFAEMVFEIGDWVLGYQQEKSGGFINDHQPETPGYTTALYLEGIGAALTLANALDDEPRARQYRESYARGFQFLDKLIIQKRDASLLPAPDFALGGLRRSIHHSEVRTDFVQHSLSAILECPRFLSGLRQSLDADEEAEPANLIHVHQELNINA